jgi:hypothetical protein
MPKTTEEEEFDTLRSYILACTDLPKESRAIRAALQGLDTELQRMERDAKLKRKFSQNNTTKEKATIKMENEKTRSPETTVADPTKNNMPTSASDDDELMDWQDVEATNKEAAGSSVLGTQLAQMAVAIMAQHGTTVTTPLAAISLALHATLCTDTLGFRCTGVLDTAAPKGFAAPIRELPKTQFVPPKWDANATEIRLRYRKAAVGSVALCVVHDGNVQVSMTPTNTNEPSSQSLTFAMDNHINLASFEKAKKKEASVLPALHYKALATLLTNFCNTFDLGSIREGNDANAEQQLPYFDSTVVPPQPPSAPLRMPPTSNNDLLRIPSRRNVPPDGSDPMRYNPYDTPTIQVFQPAGMRGDFAGDLQPPGPDFMGPGGGNLMGPGHPMFTGGGDPNMIPGNSGFGMRPRFDPVGPPGGPQDPLRQPGRGRGRGPRLPPGGLGDPNPDHARPPNNLGNNLFM